MATSMVRVKLDGVWTSLNYNSETDFYEAQFVAPVQASTSQPNGYYNLTAEAVNSSGTVYTITGNELSGLRLLVADTTAPTITLIAPIEGRITNGKPTFVATAIDEESGSGVADSTFKIYIDDIEQSGATVSEIDGVTTLSYIPTVKLGEGEHTIKFTVEDVSGNQAELIAEYIIDTESPHLEILGEISHAVIDDFTYLIKCILYDVTSPPVDIVISNNDTVVYSAEITSNYFEYELSLELGENYITIQATDKVGLETLLNLYIIRLRTDRTLAQAKALRAFTQKPRKYWTQAELEEFVKCRDHGAYNYTDMNRVTLAMEYITQWLKDYGYSSGYKRVKTTDWQESEVIYPDEIQKYIQNVRALYSVFSIRGKPVVPNRPAQLNWAAVNNIELLLVWLDSVRPLLDKSPFVSGEVFCGEV